jgi:asparagine synthetase B (glutamine-hydrolysing)
LELIFGIIDLKNRIPQQEVDAALISLSLDAKRTLISKNIHNGILALENTQESSIGEEIVTGLKDDRYNYTSASFIDGVLKLENDPLGLRPILYYHQDHLFIFSSEIEPLLELKSLSLQVSNQGIQQYLTYGITLGESTFIKNLYNLSPNSCLTFDSINGLAINKKNSHFKEQIKNPTSKNINDILTRSTQAWIEKYNIEAANLSGGADTRILLACLD